MQASNVRRAVLYGLGVATGAGLVWAGFVRDVDADPGTLVNCAAVQMQYASSIPADTPDGRELREKVLSEAEEFLDIAKRESGDHPHVLVAFGDLQLLRDDQDGALSYYDAALTTGLCDDETSAQIVLRCAEVELARGEHERSLEALKRLGELESSQFGTRSNLVAARAHLAAGRADRAIELARVAGSADDSGTKIEAAGVLESAGAVNVAEALYSSSCVESHLADYYVARLKLRESDFDTAYELLSRAVESDRPSILRLVRADEEEWRACMGTTRFKSLLHLELAAPR